MAQFSKAEREKKIEQARDMYCKGFDAQTIADIMGDMSVRTIEKWIRENNFERSRRSQLIALTEIRNSILESYADVLDGKKPRIAPDVAAKYAAAFEKFSAKKQVLIYMHEAFQKLDDEYCAEMQRAKKPAERERILAELRTMRTLSGKIIDRITNEVIGEE